MPRFQFSLRMVFVLVKLAAVVLAVTLKAGCAKEPAARDPSAPNLSGTITGSREGGLIEARSAQWKTTRNFKDFLWLSQNALPAGSSKTRVSQLLGDPLHEAALINGGTYWLYVKNDAQKGQFEALSIIFDEKGNIVGLGRKPIE